MSTRRKDVLTEEFVMDFVARIAGRPVGGGTALVGADDLTLGALEQADNGIGHRGRCSRLAPALANEGLLAVDILQVGHVRSTGAL